MFDRLVESESQGAVHSRKNYFAVTTIGMSLLSLTAIVVSIFADDYSIGRGGIELVEMIAPVEMAEVEPQPKVRQPQPRNVRTNDAKIATRTQNVINIAETPTKVPPISTAPSNVVSRPIGEKFQLGPVNAGPTGTAGTGRDTSGIGTADSSTTGLVAATPAKPEIEDDPPPAEKKAVVPKVKSGGVLNGVALALPKPVYSAAAKAVHAQGKVTVQVVLDETGRVISASAVDGNALLRSAAVDAARRARFSPTLLSGVPVKVTGVIVYNFMV